jgi:transcriptional regulator with XRE-family HTH domain
MCAAYQSNEPVRPIVRTTAFTKKDDLLVDIERQNNRLGRIVTYFVAGTFGLLSPTYLNASAATANWDINQIKISGQSEISEGATSESARDIAHIRAVAKISVSELSRAFGVSRQAVHGWIKGGTLSPRSAQRLSELARAIDVFLEAEIEASPQIFRRKAAGGQSILDAVRENGNVVELAKTLATTLARESQQRQRLAARLAERSATPNNSTEFGSPHLDENA